MDALFRRAAKDERAVEIMIDQDAADEPIGQLAQGMIEKLARVLLLSRRVKMRSNHDLTEYFLMLRKAGFPVPSELEPLEELTPFALQLRYDNIEQLGLPGLDRALLLDRIRGFRRWVTDSLDSLDA